MLDPDANADAWRGMIDALCRMEHRRGMFQGAGFVGILLAAQTIAFVVVLVKAGML